MVGDCQSPEEAVEGKAVGEWFRDCDSSWYSRPQMNVGLGG